jgi:uncharacterized protein YbjQ (UPF0145 family)
MDRFVIEQVMESLKLASASKIKDIINGEINKIKIEYSNKLEKILGELDKNNEELKTLTNQLNTQHNVIDSLLNEQIQDYLNLIKNLQYQELLLSEDMKKFQNALVRDVKKHQKIYKDLFRDNRKLAMKKLVSKIIQGNKEIKLYLALNIYLDYDLNTEITHLIALDRDKLAWNNF